MTHQFLSRRGCRDDPLVSRLVVAPTPLATYPLTETKLILAHGGSTRASSIAYTSIGVVAGEA